MKLPIATIGDVVERQLCCGCGTCAYVEPGRFRMGDAEEFGRRPFLVSEPEEEKGLAFKACPGARLEHTFERSDPDLIDELAAGWGPVYEVWEGYANDEEIRFAGSSGGAATALALYCLEQQGVAGVLHTGARKDRPFLNETVFSTSRGALLANSGSRYAPASPCDSLHWIEEASAPSVFIGKPCDVAAVQRSRRIRSQLDSKIFLNIAFFCAGTPSTRGTVELLKRVGISDPDSVRQLRYRGNGWPGMWTVEWVGGDGVKQSKQLTYEESWGFLQSYRQWRCYICPDHTGEFADVAVGDPWYRDVVPGEAGKSLLVARTHRGREVIHAAAKAGYIKLETQDVRLLPSSQPNLLMTRGSLWARLNVMRMLGAAIPTYRGFETFRYWRSALSLKQKAKSLIGTVRRVKRKRLRARVSIKETFSSADGAGNECRQ